MMSEKEMKKSHKSAHPSKSKSKSDPQCPEWQKGKCIGPHRGLKMMKDSNK